MKTIISTLALVAGIVMHPASAQSASPIGRSASAPDYAASQRIIDAYRGKSLPPAEKIEQLYARGLQPSPANIGTVRGWLAAQGSVYQKVATIRLLGSLFRDDSAPVLNLAIARDLRMQIRSGEARIALAAVQTFSRLGYQPELIGVLDEARARTLITDDDYAQEIALALPLAPAGAQPALAQKLAEKNNAFGAQVLAATVTTPEEAGRIAPQAAASLRDYMIAREPVLPMALGQFGLSDGGRYAEWLHTVAMFEQVSGKRSYAEAVWARLDNEGTDPRKILGFLTAPEGQAFVKVQGKSPKFARPAQRAAAFARQFPGHPVIEPLSQGIQYILGPTDR
jgi:hypothetical protein